jgi:hypothetical protein
MLINLTRLPGEAAVASLAITAKHTSRISTTQQRGAVPGAEGSSKQA